MNRKTFFDAIRTPVFGGFMSSAQVDGMSRILDEWDARKLTDIRWLAYMLATVFHETAKAMQPVTEMGGAAYLQGKPYYPWYGRGLVQVTWEANYAKFGVTNPGDMLQWPMALKALFEGMSKGMFSGSTLAHWFSPTVDDPVNARRIVNGTDKADLIAGYHRQFLAAVKAATAAPGPAVTSAPRPTLPSPDPVPPPKFTPYQAPQPGAWARLKGWFTGKAA